MRIISGTLRGSKLFTLEGNNTRPTLDRVKEALFSKINYDIPDATVLDLFSGSGALALESISRGAQKAYLCDSSRDAIKIIKQNIEKTRTENKTVVFNCDYKLTLEKLKENNLEFDIIFLDPPYKTDFAEDASEKIIKNNLLKDTGIIILETDNKEKVINKLDLNSLKIKDIKRYGRIYLLFLEKNIQN